MDTDKYYYDAIKHYIQVGLVCEMFVTMLIAICLMELDKLTMQQLIMALGRTLD